MKMLTNKEAKELREAERKKLRDKKYKLKENKKVWQHTNAASFVDIDDVDYLIYNNMDVTGLRAYKGFYNNEK